MLSAPLNEIRDLLKGRNFANATSSINLATTTHTIAAASVPSGQAITIYAIELGARNDHATDTLVIKIQDTAGSPVVVAEHFVDASKSLNGILDYSQFPFTLTAGKGLDVVTTGGTPNTVRIVVRYTIS